MKKKKSKSINPTSNMSEYGENTPFILIARCHVKPDKLEEYLEAAKVADAAVSNE